jgi:hypothetical protein
MHHEGNCNCRPDGNCRQGNVGVPVSLRRRQTTAKGCSTQHTPIEPQTKGGSRPLPQTRHAAHICGTPIQPPPGPPSHEEGGCPNNAMT